MAKKNEVTEESEVMAVAPEVRAQSVVEAQPEDVVDVQPEVEAPVPAKPEAQIVFDKAAAEEWLTSASARLRGVFRSVRFEPEGMPDEHIGFLLLLVGKSIMKEYTLRDRSVHEGRFFVPAYLSADRYPASFEGLEIVAQENGWAVYRVK